MTRFVWFRAHFSHIEFNFSLANVRCPAFLKTDTFVWCNSFYALVVLNVCLYRSRYDPRLDSQLLQVLILGTCCRTVRIDDPNWFVSASHYIPKIQTRPPKSNQFLQPCRLHPLPRSPLNALLQSVYRNLGLWCRHIHNTKRTSV